MSSFAPTKVKAYLSSITFGPPGFLNVATAISLDPLSIFPSYRTFWIPFLAKSVSTRSKAEVPDQDHVSTFTTARGLRQTLTEADGLISSCVPRLQQLQQCNHLRTRFEACVGPLPNLNQPRVQILLIVFVLCFLLTLIFRGLKSSLAKYGTKTGTGRQTWRQGMVSKHFKSVVFKLH